MTTLLEWSPAKFEKELDASDFTHAQFARELSYLTNSDTSPQSVREWKLGRSTPRFNTAMAISYLMQVHIDRLTEKVPVTETRA
ncbi:MAG: hypothetical protein ACPG4T_16940 [Nannocystaceae bacterium]